MPPAFREAETGAIVAELIGRAELAVVNTLNTAAEEILNGSQERVPKDDPAVHEARAARGAGYPPETLAESGHIRPATAEEPVAQVVYDGPYAGAQEAGEMTYERKTGTPVRWVATSYTTPGTGPHYLEDSGKAVVAMIPEELAVQSRMAFGILPGMTSPRSTMAAAGKRAEMAPTPTGPVAAVMTNEERLGQQASSLQTPPSAPPQLQ